MLMIYSSSTWCWVCISVFSQSESRNFNMHRGLKDFLPFPCARCYVGNNSHPHGLRSVLMDRKCLKLHFTCLKTMGVPTNVPASFTAQGFRGFTSLIPFLRLRQFRCCRVCLRGLFGDQFVNVPLWCHNCKHENR